MKVVSVINYKGGVGKTTVAANLGAELAWRGHDVLLIDLDAQASLTFSFVSPDYWRDNLADSTTIKDWFDSQMSSGARRPLADLVFEPPEIADTLSGRGRLALIASHLGLLNVDLEMATELGGATLKQAKRRFLKVHGSLAEGLAALSDDSYDIVLIDCPPNFNIVPKNAIVASSHILIPAIPDYLSTLGIDYLIRNLSRLVKDYNEYAEFDEGSAVPPVSPEILGVVFTMIRVYGGQPVAAQRPYIAQTASLDVPVFDCHIRDNKTIFADAPQYGVPVVLHPYSGGTYGNIVSEMERFVSEFEKKLGLEA